MKIYKVRMEVKGMYGMENEYKYFINKENAENFIKEHDKPWINGHGVEFHTTKIEEVIETEDKEN